MINYIKSKVSGWLQERRYLANSTVDPRGFQGRVEERLETVQTRRATPTVKVADE